MKKETETESKETCSMTLHLKYQMSDNSDSVSVFGNLSLCKVIVPRDLSR